jgi:hypothetical protein
LDESGNVIAMQATIYGMASFEQLTPGTYTVRENPIPDGFELTTLPNERTFTIISGEELVYQDGAAGLPVGDQRFETNLGYELRWGNTPPINLPPVAVCQDVTVVAGPDGTADADVDGGSYDPDGDPITIEQNPPGPYSAGETVVTLTVTDPYGLSDSCSATVRVLFLSVSIDIKPESCPNPLRLKAKGVLSVAILGTEVFDVTNIDPATVKLNREGVETGISPLRWSYEDVATPFEGELCDCHDLGQDGYDDLTLKFNVPELVAELELNDVAAETIPLILTGNLKEEFDRTYFRSEDCVWILE